MLWILGVASPHKMDGRILGEALRNPPFAAPEPREKTLSSTNADWHQFLKTVSVGDTDYLDEGNAQEAPRRISDGCKSGGKAATTP